MSESVCSEAAVLLAVASRYPYEVATADIADYLGCSGHAVAGKLRRLRSVGLVDTAPYRGWFATPAGERAGELFGEWDRDAYALAQHARRP